MTRTLMAVTLLLVPSIVAAQGPMVHHRDTQSPDPDVSLLHLMSPDQFAAAGLTRLSQSELQVLSKWVRKHALMVGQLAHGATLAPRETPSESPEVIQSRVAGDFTGWDGSTVFQLANGQVWQQSSFGSLYRFERSPKVTLVATPAGWRLEVEGVPQSIYVRRLR
jgi:hypothetical protein